MMHGMKVFARLVRALLGETAVSQKKLECGSELICLGILVFCMQCAWCAAAFTFVCAGAANYERSIV